MDKPTDLNILVTDLSGAVAVLNNEPWDWAISAISPNDRTIVPKQSSKHMIQLFDDVTRLSDVYICPNKQHVSEILKFSEQFQNGDKVLIHCAAGLSRSTAIAIAVMVQHGYGCVEAFYEVKRRRQSQLIMPNERVLTIAGHFLGDRELGLKIENLVNYEIDKAGTSWYDAGIDAPSLRAFPK